MAEIELYPGLVYRTPNKTSSTSVANTKFAKSNQRWRRNQLPENWEELTDEEQMSFAEEEDRRCTDGYWFMNNGVETYINGDHYHYLNWFKLDIGYADYRDVDRRWFYAWEICDKDPECMGINYAKKRRDGFSYRAVSIQLNRARKTFNSNFGMMSKTGDDAKECFAKLVYGFQEYPSFLKPQVQSAEDVKKELYFKAPIQRVTHKTRTVVKEMSLNTKINFKNTRENSYDGHKQKVLLSDESGKWEEANFEKWFNVAKTCLIVGGNIIGKLLNGSTVNESAKGGKAFKSVWKNSDSLIRNENGRTLSGLYRYFVPAYDGLEGFIDEYGASVIESPESPIKALDGSIIKVGSKSFLERERDAKRKAGDLVGYYEAMRQFPFDEEELFRDPASEMNIFDLDRIYEQLDYNNLQVEQNGQRLVRGNFEWIGGNRDCGEVGWMPSEKGRWLMWWTPKPDDRNKKIVKYGKPSPANEHAGVFSLDPYAAKQTSEKKHSLAASHGFRKLDLFEPDISNCFVTQYWCRPSDPLIVYEDMIKQCVFYGWPILVESNKTNCLDHFRLRGYENYLMDRPHIAHTEYSEKNQKEPGLPNFGEAVRTVLIETYQSYISNNIGVNQETNKMGNCMFNDTLDDAIKFDPEKWTDYDLTVSAMIAVVGSKKYIAPNLDRKPIQFFNTYRVNGSESVKQSDHKPGKKDADDMFRIRDL